MGKRIRFFTPAVIWLTIVTVLLTLPGSAIPKENWLDKIWADKWVHIGLFSILVILFCWAIMKTGTKKNMLNQYFLAVAVLGVAYGTGMEFIQRDWVSNRSFDVADIVADTIGCAVGLGFSRWKYIKK